MVLSLAGILVVPQIVLASWWNPFSWEVFNKAPQATEVEKLKKEVEELKKKTPTPLPPKTTNISSDKNKGIAKPVAPTRKPIMAPTQVNRQESSQLKELVTENKTKLLEASNLLSNKNVIARVKPSVVYIDTVTGSGSGIIISTDGYILTNGHVVSGINSAIVKLTNGASYTGNIIGRDENIDLALLKISATGLSAAFFGNSDLVDQGDTVFTFGYPLGIEGDVAFKDGTLSRRQKIGDTTYLEISAQILPGNSGGPLVNQEGEVIGINTLVLGTSKVNGVLIGETLKYALPINIAKTLIPELKLGKSILIPKVEIPVAPPVPKQEDSNLKIEKCKIDARTNTDSFFVPIRTAITEKFKTCIPDNIALLQREVGISSGSSNTYDSLVSVATSMCNSRAETTRNYLKSESDKKFNQEYLACLSK